MARKEICISVVVEYDDALMSREEAVKLVSPAIDDCTVFMPIGMRIVEGSCEDEGDDELDGDVRRDLRAER